MLSRDIIFLNQPPLAGNDFTHCNYARAMHGPSTLNAPNILHGTKKDRFLQKRVTKALKKHALVGRKVFLPKL